MQSSGTHETRETLPPVAPSSPQVWHTSGRSAYAGGASCEVTPPHRVVGGKVGRRHLGEERVLVGIGVEDSERGLRVCRVVATAAQIMVNRKLLGCVAVKRVGIGCALPNAPLQLHPPTGSICAPRDAVRGASTSEDSNSTADPSRALSWD